MAAYNNPRDNQGRRPPYQNDGNRPARPPAMRVTTPTPCNVTANMFKYTGKDLMLHQYAVTFTPEILKKNTFEKFMRMIEVNNFKEPFAFDGISILVSNQKFPDAVLKLPGKNSELVCKIEYKHTHDSKMSTSSGLTQCMEIISRYYQKLHFLVDKKRMFNITSAPFSLGCGLEIIPGLASTIKYIKTGVFLNLDMAFGVFYKPMPMIDLLQQFAESKARPRQQPINPLRDDMGRAMWDEFERLIKTIRVQTNHREKKSSFKISAITSTSAKQVEFEIDGKKHTVADYFAQTYRALKYPNLPLAVIKKGDLSMHLPLEVLDILPGQKYNRKLDEEMTSSMIRCAAKKPHERFDAIERKAAELASYNNEILKHFGMAFDNKMLNCKALILPAPQIKFDRDQRVQVNRGSWNLMGVSALNGVSIDDWKIFIFRSNDSISGSLIDSFVNIAKNYGVCFNKTPQTVLVRNIDEFCDAPKCFFNLVVLPDKSARNYENVKRVAETFNGVYTQCLVSANIGKLSNPSFASNLLLKINAKLGGRNWSIDSKIYDDKKTILFGIDVNHPGVTDFESPSIVSIVASMDYEYINYKTIIEQQPRRQEIVGTLVANVKSLLKSHYGATRSKPDRIVVFRDGVGDSMFEAVYASEIQSIKQACTELDATYNPEINFVIAQKRHSVRFMYNGDNVVPGTIVDEINTPGVFDFFLVSHHALQGTARPVRYLVIRNDSNFTPQQWYESTYALTHLYARATKSVSVVPPIYYAHLGAARGKCYLDKNNEGVVNMRACLPNIQKTLYYV